MPILQLSDQQVVDLIKQLAPERQEAVFRMLLMQQWPSWASGVAYGEVRARATAAARGRNWDAMTDEEREDFVDDLVHEDRACIR
jgi:hypothetical protein